MHPVIIEEPYQFVPPHPGRLWPRLLHPLTALYARKKHGIQHAEFRGLSHLQESIAAGHGILLTPNHCRPCDPLMLSFLSRKIGHPFFTVASWHVFKQGALTSFLARRSGAFSIYREGLDRESLRCAQEILTAASRPLVIFPEGVVTRTNALLSSLMDGTALIARSAARKRSGPVVVHPIALRYELLSDVSDSLSNLLSTMERRLTWPARPQEPLLDRIRRVGRALLTLKELEFLGTTHTDSIEARTERVINHLLTPIETQWLSGPQDDPVVGRVKKLRTAIVPDLIEGEITSEERDQRWQQLAAVYLAQQIAFYPSGYLEGEPRPERLLETVERFEEDLTDEARVHGPLKVVIDIAPAITVEADRPPRGAEDPLMVQIEAALRSRLSGL